MARRTDHSREELKELIIKTAWQIAATDGFEKLTVRTIAKHIGYAPGTIYNIFANIEELYLAVNGMTLDLLHQHLSQNKLVKSGNDITAPFKQLARSYLAFITKHHNSWLMLFTQTPDINQDIPNWYAVKILKLFEIIENDLKSICPPDEATKQARILWSAVHGLFFLDATHKLTYITGKNQSLEMVDNLIDTFISGLKNPIK